MAKWKSVSGQRADVSPTEQQPLSEDFIKKLETWKQIKSHSYSTNEDDKKGNKTPSPKLCRKDGGSSRQKNELSKAVSSEPELLAATEYDDEPEAVIVEVEDIVEETAAPLFYFTEKKHTPIYQHQETRLKVKTKAAPTVQRSESTRAQRNYNLIEEIIDLLKLLTENENTITNRELNMEQNEEEDETIISDCLKKKLQEWQRIKKGLAKDDGSSNNSSQKKKLGEWPKWKSVSGQRADVSPTEQQPLSEDFIKKLETWKQIKSHSYSTNEDDKKGNKTPSPKLCRKDGGSSRQSKKAKEQPDKGLHWFEKELGKIEREKQRLERERQKFLEREERLTKLRKSVMTDNKQNILVQTPSGFYRFEGISRQFTQKLYEWEKAQGIAPEASTFALLSNCYVPTININGKHESQSRLVKSKSADSVMNSELNLTHPLLSQQPSSLSLNDVDNLENELSKAVSSEPELLAATEYDDEPEAVIVEVEDIVEETAAPLFYFTEKKHTPIYQHQETRCICEGQTKAAPTVQRSESTRAQRNYNLIEEIIDLLKLLTENENTITNRELNMEQNEEEDETIISDCLKNLYTLQTDCSTRLIEKLVLLQEANSKVTSSIAKDEVDYTTNRFVEVLDSVQDLSVDLLQLAEKLHTELLNRSTARVYLFNSKDKYRNIPYILQQQNSKILELRRVLSYLCAASDSTAPGKKKKIPRTRGLFRKSSSKEKDKLKGSSSKENSSPNSVTSRQKSRDNWESDEDLNAQIAQGAIKKRYRYRQADLHKGAIDDSDDDEIRLQKKVKIKPPQASAADNTIIDNDQADNYEESIPTSMSLDPDVIQKVAVPTKLNYVSVTEPIPRTSNGSPIQVFVKTTRKLFTPLVMSSFATECQKMEVTASPTVVSVPSFHRNPSIKDFNITNGNDDQNCQASTTVKHLPPLPASPTTQRKMNKEISPNIRLMLAKYTQKIQEHESPGYKSGGSSGSSSPVAWRSPINERRVRTQTERYQQELLKLSPLQVQKSASLSFMNKNTVPYTSQPSSEKITTNAKGILKSSSACALTARVRSEQSVTIAEENSQKCKGGSLKLSIPPETNQRLYNSSRRYKLQKAKEDFLNSPIPTSAPPMLPNENIVKYPERNRLSQISVGSESSHDSSAYEGVLIKSASAGMINVDPETYKQIQPEIHGGGYVSLPRTSKKRKRRDYV
ncbi:hypothetical protein MML48_6g00004276 [Holotrichia oblita]|uniref:Uncharacterized protein n=1 Tax=Holotrichia oblita TaxID=644536 RepID=A0ACB9SXR0_HOLOL|nr:hypothetical protein MML48_6g00004276 [Holotrichia oblita]